eukprot:6305376-Amphidinium_carterae.1
MEASKRRQQLAAQTALASEGPNTWINYRTQTLHCKTAYVAILWVSTPSYFDTIPPGGLQHKERLQENQSTEKPSPQGRGLTQALRATCLVDC